LHLTVGDGKTKKASGPLRRDDGQNLAMLQLQGCALAPPLTVKTRIRANFRRSGDRFSVLEVSGAILHNSRLSPSCAMKRPVETTEDFKAHIAAIIGDRTEHIAGAPRPNPVLVRTKRAMRAQKRRRR